MSHINDSFANYWMIHYRFFVRFSLYFYISLTFLMFLNNLLSIHSFLLSLASWNFCKIENFIFLEIQKCVVFEVKISRILFISSLTLTRRLYYRCRYLAEIRIFNLVLREYLWKISDKNEPFLTKLYLVKLISSRFYCLRKSSLVYLWLFRRFFGLFFRVSRRIYL